MLGIVFAAIAMASSIAMLRPLGMRTCPGDLLLAPAVGLAVLVVLTSWVVALGLPPPVGTGLVVVVTLAGVVGLWRQIGWGRPRLAPVPWLLLAFASAVPAVVLGLAFAGLDVPISNHDGAFHVETIDAIRRGGQVGTGWYPPGYHAMLAAILGLAPWIDTARGTQEASEGLAPLAPLAAFALGSALGLSPLAASLGAVVLAVTFIYPYDYHLWGGWPLGMSLVLLLGLLSVALRWIEQPDSRWAVLGGCLLGGIVLTHGTEVYSGAVGLAVIALSRARAIDWRRLMRDLPLGVGLALAISAAYLPVALGWAGAGGATTTGQAIFDELTRHPELESRGDWLQFGLGLTGAASWLDLPARLGLLLIGLAGAVRCPRRRLVVSLWAIFAALLLAFDVLDGPLVQRVFVVTFPWLVDHRLRQIVVVFASLLIGTGLVAGLERLKRLRPRLERAGRPHAWRRLAIACGLVAAFLAEGSAVSIYKRLTQDVADQRVFSTDDGRALAWLRQHARPDEVVANDEAADAGIWAPYKANVRILLPRSAAGPATRERKLVAEHLLDLDATPDALAVACALHVDWVYQGARRFPYDVPLFPAPAELERSPALEAAFRSGQAVVYRTRLPCD